ncbi:MAG: Flp pilus assembly complex ATPase component TadA, partial [Chloroflexi bacterium]|nr:Flp pilus assembly complex ATPase component TadA [Chloroflexota bacterium]
GKTTVLYASLKLFDAETRNIAAVDGEIALRVQGVNRVLASQGSEDIVRTLLTRHDLDVLALPEIESRAGADLALEAGSALLALAPLYADDALHAIGRLLRWGISPYVVTGGLAGVISSRLARRICTDCLTTYEPDSAALRALGLPPEQAAGAEFRKGAGCEACRKTGYRGRLAFYEGIALDRGLSRLLESSAGDATLRQYAREQGMRTLRDDARAAVLRGVTTAEEAVRALGPRAR